jgi:hypothetical protein
MMDEPKEQLTEMRESAAGLHELFVTLKAVGFTEWQALRLLGVMLAEQGRQS